MVPRIREVVPPVGSRVTLKFGGRDVVATVIEDRGPLAGDGRRLLRVRVPLTDTKIVMGELVTHPGDLSPWNVRVGSRQTRRQSFDGLADDLQVANHGVLRLTVRHEGVATSRRVRNDGVDRVAHVQQVDAIVLHTATASARIPFRRYGLSPASETTSTGRPSNS